MYKIYTRITGRLIIFAQEILSSYFTLKLSKATKHFSDNTLVNTLLELRVTKGWHLRAWGEKMVPNKIPGWDTDLKMRLGCLTGGFKQIEVLFASRRRKCGTLIITLHFCILLTSATEGDKQVPFGILGWKDGTKRSHRLIYQRENEVGEPYRRI